MFVRGLETIETELANRQTSEFV